MKKYLPACEDWTECSETLAYKLQMLVNHPEESIKRAEHNKSLNSRIVPFLFHELSNGLFFLY
jgi:Fe-S cluster biosynthesis and repair protein YggX